MKQPPVQPHFTPKSIGGLALAVLLLMATAPAVLAADPGAASLTVVFQGIKTATGPLMVSLAADPTAYAGKAPAAAQAMVNVSGASATVTFGGLKPGTYAIRAFHDLNGDGKLNTNPFGVPTEPYAFSNNAHGVMGPAPWEAAAFDVKPGENRQTIDID